MCKLTGRHWWTNGMQLIYKMSWGTEIWDFLWEGHFGGEFIYKGEKFTRVTLIALSSFPFSTTALVIWFPHLNLCVFFSAATKQLYEWYFPSVSPSVCPSVGLSHLFSCDQAALWMVQSVRLSVRLSVCPSVRLSVTPFWLCSHHPIIMTFSGVITSDKSDVHAKCQGQRSKVKVTEVTTQLNRFRTVTPVWIRMWRWNDAYSLMLLRRGALLFFKVIRQISRSHGSKNRRIWPRLGVSGL